MRRNFVTGITVVHISLLSIFCTTTLFGYLLSLLSLSDKVRETKLGITNTYLYLEKDYLRNKTSTGVVSLIKKIDDYEFYDSFQEPTKRVLISPFGTEEFECFGSCYCEEHFHERRTSYRTFLLSNRLSVLLASVSSALAFKKANEYFSEKCDSEFSDSTNCKSIKSEVNSCENIVDDSQSSSSLSPYPPIQKTFFCYGNCLDNLKFGPGKFRRFRPTAEEKGLDCKKMKTENEVVVKSNEVIQKSPNVGLNSRMSYTARRKFVELFLVPFCRKNSKVEYDLIYHYKSKRGDKESFHSQQSTGYMCVANRARKGGVVSSNVKCRQIDPKPTSPNTEYWDKRFWKEKKDWDEQ